MNLPEWLDDVPVRTQLVGMWLLLGATWALSVAIAPPAELPRGVRTFAGLLGVGIPILVLAGWRMKAATVRLRRLREESPV